MFECSLQAFQRWVGTNLGKRTKLEPKKMKEKKIRVGNLAYKQDKTLVNWKLVILDALTVTSEYMVVMTNHLLEISLVVLSHMLSLLIVTEYKKAFFSDVKI